ncbi:MAG: P-loop NTPase [Desulfopila sp.]|jgi:flagellar biosynthesis protein FlhG|nr:P-loop NTPase [Desulfopila sp.]
MSITVSVGSGKGGTGKSMVLANLAFLLAREGRKVCIIDLDVGGANAHILFGLFEPRYTLTDFLSRKVEDLSECVHTFDTFYGLQLIPGTGDTLQTANMSYQEKQRLLRAISSIDADIILLDVGAGSSYHCLDFFMRADLQICITTPEPTSIMDFYRFIQLATIRKALASFLSQSEVSKTLKQHNFQTIAEVFEQAEQLDGDARRKIQHELQSFHPLLIINKVGSGSKLNTLKLKKITSTYLGIYLPELGEIPVDDDVPQSIQAYMPICEYSPKSKASQALQTIQGKLAKIIDLFEK